MLVLRREVLDRGDAGIPESEEVDEDCGAVGEREVVHACRSFSLRRGGGEGGLEGVEPWGEVGRNKDTMRAIITQHIAVLRAGW